MCRALPKALLLPAMHWSVSVRAAPFFPPSPVPSLLASFSPSPNSLFPVRLLGAWQCSFMGWCRTWQAWQVWCFLCWGLIKCCFQASWCLRLLWISCISKYITNFLGLRATYELGRSKDNVRFLTQMELRREVKSLVGLYRRFQIHKGFAFSPVWTLGWSQFPFPFSSGSSFLREHICSFPKKSISHIYNFSHLEMKL